MKPSKIFGNEEECQSSESGWTMYIGSHIEDDDDEDINDSGDDEGTIHQANPEDDESDDSMVSDASSGPSHQHGNIIGKRVNYGLKSFKQVVVEVEENRQYDDENKYCLKKKANKTVEKQMEEKKEMKFVDDNGNGKGKSSVQGGGKVRKRK